MNEKIYDIDYIKTHHRNVGGYFFEPSTMKFHKGRILEAVYQGAGGVFFVHSTKAPTFGGRVSARVYKVAQYDPQTGSVRNFGDKQFDTARAAGRWAQVVADTDIEAVANAVWYALDEQERTQVLIYRGGGESESLIEQDDLNGLQDAAGSLRHYLAFDYEDEYPDGTIRFN